MWCQLWLFIYKSLLWLSWSLFQENNKDLKEWTQKQNLEWNLQIPVLVNVVIHGIPPSYPHNVKVRLHLSSALAIWQFFLNDLASPFSFSIIRILWLYSHQFLPAGKKKEYYFCLTYSWSLFEYPWLP